MDLNSFLAEYRQSADKILEDFWESELRHAQKFKVDSLDQNLATTMVETYRAYIGGKRLRGMLVCLGYAMHAPDWHTVVPAGVGAELIHHFLLMHDDVADGDRLRHNHDAIHVTFEKFGQQINERNATHYGQSIAYFLGDIGSFWGNDLVASVQLPPERVLKALRFMNQYLVETGFGQALDMTLAGQNTIVEQDVLTIHHYKTARYSLSGPLKLGAILAAADQTVFDAIETYGDNVGIAFQLRDDELGLFGDSDTIGKPAGSDIIENKYTVLHLKAIELSSPQEKLLLQKLYGKPELTPTELDQVRQITQDSGALEYSHQLKSTLLQRGIQAIPQITHDPQWQSVLQQLADYIGTREV